MRTLQGAFDHIQCDPRRSSILNSQPTLKFIPLNWRMLRGHLPSGRHFLLKTMKSTAGSGSTWTTSPMVHTMFHGSLTVINIGGGPPVGYIMSYPNSLLIKDLNEALITCPRGTKPANLADTSRVTLSTDHLMVIVVDNTIQLVGVIDHGLLEPMFT